MKYIRVLTLALMFCSAHLSSLPAEAQNSRQVSGPPWFLQNWSSYSSSAPLQLRFQFFERLALELDPRQRSEMNFYETVEVLEGADRWFLIEAASEEIFLPFYDQGIASGNDMQVVAALAYLTGLASPLLPITVTEHTRIVPDFLLPSDVRKTTYTVTYSLNRGPVRYCQTIVEKDRHTDEITRIDFSGCPHYVDEP